MIPCPKLNISPLHKLTNGTMLYSTENETGYTQDLLPYSKL